MGEQLYRTKHVDNAIRETELFPNLRFDLKVIVHGHEHQYRNLKAIEARDTLRCCTDCMELVTH